VTESRANDRHVPLPVAPQPPTPFRFPLVAATVPVLASAAIWLITGSSFALIFAALGPLAAVGTFVDSRINARKVARTEHERFADDLIKARKTIEAYHRSECAELAERTPTAIALVKDVRTDTSRWTRQSHDELPVFLGLGAVPSAVTIDALGMRENTPSAATETYRELIHEAEFLQRAPVTVDARLGIAVFGTTPMALSLARSVAIQLARTISPANNWVRFSGVFAAEAWTRRLPHSVLPSDRAGASDTQTDAAGGELAQISWGRAGDSVPHGSVTVVSQEQHVPSGHRIVAQVSGDRVAVVRHPNRHERRDFEPSFLGREQALAWARTAGEIAVRDGLTSEHGQMPLSLKFGELATELDTVEASATERRQTLRAYPAAGKSGAVGLDLVAQGPHAIVGGTTGSGKSELLIAWVLAIAAARSPDDVNFLLIDFKGGAAFAGLTALPQVVGLITDLDDAAAARAFASLRAELRYRERTLAEAGVRDISELKHLPRLVIVVDEFAAMLEDYPQLHTQFCDISARGRSLGVHLILCTQRPSGTVRDALLANADLRISLRVNNRADSSAVIGSDLGAQLPADAKGRAWMVHGSSSAELVQFALVSPHDIESVAAAWSEASLPRRPWCEPLGTQIALKSLQSIPSSSGQQDEHDDVHADSRAFGATDVPEQQRHGIAYWSPSSDGHLLVLGASGSGKSTALATVAEGGHAEIIVMETQPAGFWDALTVLSSRLDEVGSGDEHDGPNALCSDDRGVAQQPQTLAFIDDLDALIARFDEEYRAAMLERLTRILREGPSRGLWIVAAAQRITPALQPVAALMPSVVRLRFDSRQEFVLSGASGAAYVDGLPPGGGHWKRTRLQVAQSENTLRLSAGPGSPELARTGSIVVVSGRPAATAAACAAAGWAIRQVGGAPGSEHDLLVDSGDPHCLIALIGSIDDWHSRWGAISALRSQTRILVDGCSLSDYRQLARTRDLPPPLAAGEYWCLAQDGSVGRVRLPSDATDGGK